jgi:hypothetical protein
VVHMLKGFYRPPLVALGVAGALSVTAAVSQTMPSQEQMMKVGECMANLDPSAMESMERKGEAFEADLKRLCKAGNRDAALQRARQFGLEMVNDPAMKQIKACTAGIKMPIQNYEVPKERLTTDDICSH